jgi:hypothetical protein
MKSKGKLECGLIARIKRGDDIASIRKWFLQELRETDFKIGDLTPFEESFFKLTVEAYMAWEREKRELEERKRKLN